MMLEISCPSCKAGYLVEQSAQGAEFVCPECTTTFLVPATVAAANPPVSDHELPPRAPEPPAARLEPPHKHVAAREAHVEAVMEDEVVCPRCQLHFTPQARHASPRHGARPRVLVVEEPGFFLTTAQETLSSEYEVVTASTVNEAQQALAAAEVDLLLLNLDVEGEDSGRELLPGPFAKRCPVLIFSADDESRTYGAEWEELQQLGADDIVLKGMNVAESLSRKVRTLLGYPVGDLEDGPS